MDGRMQRNKEKYFDDFCNVIKLIQNKESIENYDVEKFYTEIVNFENLSFQDILTYMLYCFEVIELTNKWKFKKLINYDYFISNIDAIYTEIFCDANSKFNNKIIAATSLGNIIEKTIIYNVENQIESVLINYLKAVGSKKSYLQNNELLLLRGNLYCQIYNVIKDNISINDICNRYYGSLQKIFDYNKYIESATNFYNNFFHRKDISYFDLNNFLSFKTYNKFDFSVKEFDLIFKLFFNDYRYDFFDKKLFIYLFDKYFANLINDKNLNITLEFVFEEKLDNHNTIFVNYNSFDCIFNNNINLLKDIFYRINKIKYSDINNCDEYMQLLKLTDDLILKKCDENNSIFNYDNIILFKSLEEFNIHFNQADNKDFYSMIIDYKKEYNNIKSSEGIQNIEITNFEIFDRVYSVIERKNLLNEYPLLSLEYDENGVYKPVGSILQEKLMYALKLQSNDCNFDDKVKLYDLIISYRNMDLYSLLNDYYSLLIIDSVDSVLIKEKEYILKNILPNLLLHKMSFCGKMSKSEFDEIYNDYINPCIKKISQNRVSNRSFESTKDFLNFEKSNADNYFGICKLQEILEQKSETVV